MVFIAEQRLKDAGYGEKSLLAPQDDDDEETSMKLVIRIFYLVQLIEQPITNPEFLQRIFCLFTFSVVFTVAINDLLCMKNAGIQIAMDFS